MQYRKVETINDAGYIIQFWTNDVYEIQIIQDKKRDTRCHVLNKPGMNKQPYRVDLAIHGSAKNQSLELHVTVGQTSLTYKQTQEYANVWAKYAAEIKAIQKCFIQPLNQNDFDFNADVIQYE